MGFWSELGSAVVATLNAVAKVEMEAQESRASDRIVDEIVVQLCSCHSDASRLRLVRRFSEVPMSGDQVRKVLSTFILDTNRGDALRLLGGDLSRIEQARLVDTFNLTRQGILALEELDEDETRRVG